MRPAHAVEPPVQLGERLGQLVGQRLHRPEQRREHGVLRVELGDGLVEPLGEDAHLGAVGQLGEPLAHVAQRVERGQPGVDLVERVEDLLLLAVADLGGAHEHAAHAVERKSRFIAHGAGSFLRAGIGVHSE